MSAPLWVPTQAQVDQSNLAAFRAWLQANRGVSLSDYDALYDWSVDEHDVFWHALLEWSGVISDGSSVPVRTGQGIQHARWFPELQLNFAENLLRHRGSDLAIIATDERELDPKTWTRDELRSQVAKLQHTLRELGVGPGDRVAGFMPNRGETVVAMLATASLGAIWSSSSPDFGFKGVLDRFGQIEPKVLFCAESYSYGGKVFDCLGKVERIAQAIPSIGHIIVVDGHGEPQDLSGLRNPIRFGTALDHPATAPSFTRLPFDHPLYILYSSGTTGVPKCIVHGAGGTLLQHIKEHALHTDLRPDDRLFYFTTCGWMMWNWLVSGLAIGAPIVLFDGSPAAPDLGVLWRMAERFGVTVFGTSPKFLSICEKEGIEPAQHDLKLRAMLSTGSPLSIENFEWVYRSVGSIQLASISGGTDIVSCFMLGCPTAPVWPGEIQKRGLGMAVEAWNGSGKAVIGQKGELVCTKPFPSRPVSFWNDPDGARYHRAYFDVYPGVWRHGDWVEVTEHGGVIVYGRSDATLNPGGVRIGTAEIYRPVDAMDEIVESVVVGLPKGGDVVVALFVVVRDGVSLDDALRKRIRTAIRKNASPRHVPAILEAVPAVPRTISGKKVELAVARMLQGQGVPNRDALGNPDALQAFAALAPSLGLDA